MLDPVRPIVEAVAGHEWKISVVRLAIVADQRDLAAELLQAFSEGFDEHLQHAGRWDASTSVTKWDLSPLVELRIRGIVATTGASLVSLARSTVGPGRHQYAATIISASALMGGEMNHEVTMLTTEDDGGTWEPKIWAVA